MKGLLIKSTGSWYTIETENGTQMDCRIKGVFRIKGNKNTNPLAVGDIIEYEHDEDGKGLIVDLYPRKNYIIRKSVNLSRQDHIIAANLDQALLFITIKQPDTPLGFIDRFLVTAEAYKVPVVLVFNKADLYDEDELEVVKALMHEYSKIGYQCILNSTFNSDLEPLKQLLKNKVTLVAGNSGAGKSSLINAVQPGLGLKIGSVSEYHEKGMHTTTFAEMFKLDFGGWIIDSPGIKGFGLIDMEKEELCHYFPEMKKLSEHCKFHNCKHQNEPGCAVKNALDKGEIWENRYVNYLSIYNDNEAESYR